MLDGKRLGSQASEAEQENDPELAVLIILTAVNGYTPRPLRILPHPMEGRRSESTNIRCRGHIIAVRCNEETMHL